MSWITPATSYPRRSLGGASVRSHVYRPGVYVGLGYAYQFSEPTKITNLCVDGVVWMVDDPAHWWKIQQHAEDMHGTVVCAGLGLGLVAHALHGNDEVRSIVVVERDQDVIDLIGPQLPQEKLTIVHKDWWQMKDCRLRPDFVFFDLFVGQIGIDEAARAVIGCRVMFPEAKVVVFGFS